MVIRQFRESYKSFDAVAIRELSESLNYITRQYNLWPLEDFAKNFNFDCLSRDQNQVNICFSRFEKLIDRIELEKKKRFEKTR